MSDYEQGQILATNTLLIVLMNNLRGLGILNDVLVREIFDETLENLERVHSDMVQKFGEGSSQSAIVAVARSAVEHEIARELSYPKRGE